MKITMSVIERRNRRRNLFLVRLEFEDARISEKFLRYLRIRMMTRTDEISSKASPIRDVHILP